MAKETIKRPVRGTSAWAAHPGTAKILAIFGAALAAAGTCSTAYYLEGQKQADEADPYRHLSKEAALDAALAELSAAEEKKLLTGVALVSAYRNWKPGEDEWRAFAREIIEAGKNPAKMPKEYRPVADIVGALYKDETFASPLPAVVKGLKLEPTAAVKEEGLMASVLEMISSHLPGGGGSGLKTPEVPYAKQVRELNGKINENLLKTLDRSLASDLGKVKTDPTVVELFKETGSRMAGLGRKIDKLQEQMEKERNRTEPFPSAEEQMQYDMMLKALGQVKTDLGSGDRKLTRELGPNMEIMEKRLALARGTLKDFEDRLTNDLAWLDQQKVNGETNMEFMTQDMLARQELMLRQQFLARAIDVEVQRVELLVQGKGPTDQVIRRDTELETEARAFAAALREMPKDTKLPDGDAAKLLERLEKFQADGKAFEGELVVAFPKYDREGNYDFKDTGNRQKAFRQQKPRPVAPKVDLGSAEAREHLAGELVKYADELQGWNHTWKNTAAGQARLAEENAERTSLPYLERNVKTLEGLVKAHEEDSQQFAAAADAFLKAAKGYSKAKTHYNSVLARPDIGIQPFSREEWEEDKQAGKEKGGGDATPTGHGFKPEPMPSARPGIRSFGGVNVRGAQRNPTAPFHFDYKPPKDFLGYYSPSVPKEEKFAYLWGSHGEANKDVIFASSERYIGNEPYEVTKSRIDEARLNISRKGATGINCIGAATMGMSDEERKVFQATHLGTDIMVSMDKGEPGIGDILIYTNGRYHAGKIVAERQDEHGNPVYTSSNGNFNEGLKLRDGNPPRGGEPSRLPSGWVPRAKIAEMAAQNVALKHAIEAQQEQDAPRLLPASDITVEGTGRGRFRQ